MKIDNKDQIVILAGGIGKRHMVIKYNDNNN